MNKKQTGTIVTPVSVLKQFLELDKHVSKLDVHRLDKEGLYNYICCILSDETIKKLNDFRERDTNNAIIDSVLKSGGLLPWLFAKPLSDRLIKLHANDAGLENIQHYIFHSRRSNTWNKYKVWLVLLIVLLLCCLIYIISV